MEMASLRQSLLSLHCLVLFAYRNYYQHLLLLSTNLDLSTKRRNDCHPFNPTCLPRKSFLLEIDLQVIRNAPLSDDLRLLHNLLLPFWSNGKSGRVKRVREARLLKQNGLVGPLQDRLNHSKEQTSWRVGECVLVYRPFVCYLTVLFRLQGAWRLDYRKL